MTSSTMRVSYPPVRYSDDEQEVVVPPRRLELKPFEGQPRKWAGIHRFPQLVMKKSLIHNSGVGLFLKESVRAGQAITLFRRNRISEAKAKLLKIKVANPMNIPFC
jgi:hypothetical protein